MGFALTKLVLNIGITRECPVGCSKVRQNMAEPPRNIGLGQLAGVTADGGLPS